MKNAEEKINLTAGVETSSNETKNENPKRKKRKKKILKKILLWIFLTPLLLILATVIVLFIILYGRIATMASVEQVGDKFYKVDFQQDYHLDEALASEITTEEELLNFICEKMFFGYGVDANLSKYSCSAFIFPTDDGKYLTGRSFGLGGTDKIAVYAHPKDGYASMSMVSLDPLGLGEENGIDTLSLEGRALVLAAPYIAVDGVNEKGVTASLLDLSDGETHQDEGKPDLISTLAVRLILDKAGSVDEAIELLKQYDMHSVHGAKQHIFISDATGDSAVAEWRSRQMEDNRFHVELVVTRSHICTNFPLYQEMETIPCDRFLIIQKELDGKSEISGKFAMRILSEVYQYETPTIFTEWSVVYYQNDFTMDVAIQTDFDTVYHLEPSDF
jgi:Penicillin V acylase and related amidases